MNVMRFYGYGTAGSIAKELSYTKSIKWSNSGKKRRFEEILVFKNEISRESQQKLMAVQGVKSSQNK